MSKIRFTRLVLHDFGPFADAELDLADQGLVLILAENNDTSAADSNGSGKTHLFMALTWALFGRVPQGDKFSHGTVIRRGTATSEKASVEVCWEDETGAWTLTRSQGKQMQLSLSRAGVDVSGSTMKDTQEGIEKALGIDFHTWCSTVMYCQGGDVGRFAHPETDDTERKYILKRIMRLDVLDKAAKIAKVHADEIGKERSKVQFAITQLETQRSFVERMITTHTTALLVSKKALAGLAKSAASDKRLKGLEAEIRGVLAENEARRSAVAEHRRKSRAHVTAATERMLEIRQLRTTHTELQAQRERFAAGRCPECNTPTTGKDVKARLRAYDDELARLTGEIERLWSGPAESSAAATAAEAAAEALEAEIKREGDDWRGRLSDVQGKIRAISLLSAERERLAGSVADAQKRLDEAKSQAKDWDKEKTVHEAKVEEWSDEINHLNFWAKGFGNSGLPSRMMDDIAPELTDRANYYLDILADGDIHVRFDTEVVLKGGAVRDKFTLTSDIEGAGDTLASGGQSRKITLATDLALMDILASRERSAIDLLLLDEVLDGLDATGKARVMDLLMDLRASRGSVFVISHDPAIAEMFERTIKVVKSGGISRLEA